MKRGSRKIRKRVMGFMVCICESLYSAWRKWLECVGKNFATILILVIDRKIK